MKATMRSTGHWMARLLSYAISLRMLAIATRVRNRLLWNALRRRFQSVGPASFVEFPVVSRGERYISIGSNFQSYARLRLEAYDRHLGNVYHPEIVIGDNVSFNYDCHLACINRLVIGNNVLVGSRVHITDHSHGEVTGEALKTPPARRALTSKGPVIIEDNVWIGEGAVIMPNVRIGMNAIVGANAVVTRDVPANSVVGGVPARVIKYL